MSLSQSPLAFSVVCVALAVAQSTDVPDWQTAAGGKQAFEVASLKPSKVFKRPSFPLNNRDSKPAGGRFSASLPLEMYLTFAYKLEPFQVSAAMAKLPKSVSTDFYQIEARAEDNPAKDQIRLMMQSLLAERFKLAVHFETQEVPVFGLTLIKGGKTGPKLRPHAEGPPCPEFTMPERGVRPDPGDVFPRNCGTAESRSNRGAWLMGSRNTTMPSLAAAITSYGTLAGEVDKPVVDRTRLDGRFDFTMEYWPDPTRNRSVAQGPPNPDIPPPDPRGPGFLQALRDQLGFKLVAAKAPMQILVIDHVEKPSEN